MIPAEEKKPIANTNKFFISIYIILYLALPAVLMLISLGFKDYPIQKGNFAATSRVLFFFVSLPVYVVYAGIILKALAQMAAKWMLLLFVPHVANLVWYAYNYQFSSDWLRLMVFDSIPMYSGLNICFFIGLLILMISVTIATIKKEGTKTLAARILVTLIVMLAIFTPVVFFFIVGWNMAQTYNPDNTSIGIFKYLFSIVLVIFSHYKVIIDLYKKGQF